MIIKPTWHDMERDTADWASARQLAWRRQAPAWAKLEAVNQLYQMGRTLAYSGLRQRHPQATAEELAQRLADRLLGSHLSAQVYHSPRQIEPTMFSSPIQVTLLVIEALEALGVPYLIGGSVASALYGVERMTMDADVVADLRPEHVAPLVQRLGESFYMDVPAVLEAILRQSSFNMIHQATMFKVDIFILKHRPFDQMQLSRRIEQPVAFEPEQRAYFASVEDTILAKLEWYRLGGEVSERQWRDVLGVIRTQADRLDLGYLRQWAPELDVADLLELALVNAYQ